MRKAVILAATWLLPGFSSAAQAPLAVKAIAAGGHHSLALASDGTVWAWGYQYGANTRATSARAAPSRVGELSGIVAIAAGGTHSLAARGDGTVWAWGGTWCWGGPGVATPPLTSTPIQVSALSQVVAVAGGWSFSLALKGDGTVWAWGCGDFEQLGHVFGTYRATPIQVSGLTRVLSINAGYGHALAVKDDGTVWTWGLNRSGQLGDGTVITDAGRPAPVQVSGLTGVVAVAGGFAHSLALKGNGTVWAWGSNDSGQLGDGTTASRSTPIQVSGLTGVTAITAGGAYSLAIKGDGTVWAWGYNEYGQLGDGTTANRLTPVQVSGLSGAVAVAGSRSPSDSDTDGHSLALKDDGTVWAWGLDDRGELGDGAVTASSVPLQVSGLTDVVGIAAGDSHSLGVKADGTAWAWGYNEVGELGDGTTTNRSAPVQVSGLSGVVAVAAGAGHSLALKGDGTAWAWGYNRDGQLGDGTTANRFVPVQVSGLSQAVAIAAGNRESSALRDDGTVWKWPTGNSFVVEDGKPVITGRVLTPAQVNGISGMVAIASGWETDFGFNQSLALKGDGSVWEWPWTSLGLMPVPGLSGVVGIAVGTEFPGFAPANLALKDDGTVWTWRWGAPPPTQLSAPDGITAVSMGGAAHSLALRKDGTVWAWGLNEVGQLGDGTTTDRTTPVQVAGLTRIVAVAARGYFSLALKADGTVWAWGRNVLGELGISATTRSTPVQVIPPGSPDLAIAMSHAGEFTTGERGIYTLTITNVGSTATTGMTTVTDTLPPGLSYISATGDGWICSAADQLVTCTASVPLEPAASSTITLTVEVGASAVPGVTNLARVSNESDRNIVNNAAGDPAVVRQP